MNAVRRLLAHRVLAAMLCAAAMLLKLAVPSGYMLTSDRGGPALAWCTGMAPLAAAMPGMAMPGMTTAHGAHRHGGGGGHERAEQPCAFAGLTAPMIGPVDPGLIAAPLAFVAAAAITAMRVAPPAPPARLRPPLRGPPLPA